MTAPTRTSVPVFDAQVSAIANSTALTAMSAVGATNGNGGWVDVRAFNGGYLGIAVTNGSSAPGVALKYVIEVTDVSGSAFFVDRWASAGDTVASGYPKSTAIHIPAEFSYIRVLAFGHTINPVGLKAVFFGKA